MSQMNAFVDDKPLNLMEHRCVRRIAVAAIHTARRDDANGRFLRRHGADLDGRCVRAQNHFLAIACHFVREVKSIMHGACRMRLWNIERSEIVPVVFNFWPFGHSKSHIGENLCQLVHDLAYGVYGSAWRFWRGQCHIDALAGETAV